MNLQDSFEISGVADITQDGEDIPISDTYYGKGEKFSVVTSFSGEDMICCFT